MTSTPGEPLRFVLLTGGGTIERWLAEAIARAEASGDARCVGVVKADPPLQMPNRAGSLGAVLRSPKHWAHFALRATLLRTALTAAVPLEDALPGAPVHLVGIDQRGSVVRLTAESVANLRARALDFILLGEFGILKGDVLTASRHGVWSHHHGDPRRYRGRPSCFWELHDGAREVSAGIQRLTETLDGGHFMALATVETEPSFGRTMERLYDASTALLGTASGHVRRHEMLPERLPLPEPLPPVHRRPTNGQVARAVLHVMWARVSRRSRRTAQPR